jgi:single-strand DNA-binding protein
MSGNLNRVCLIGNVSQEPTMRYAGGGQPVTSFGLATNHFASGGGDRENRPFTDYHNIVAWNIGKRELAQFASDYVHVGQSLYVEGRLQTRSWEGQDGQKRRTTEVVAWDIQLLEAEGQPDLTAVGSDRPLAQIAAVDVDSVPF